MLFQESRRSWSIRWKKENQTISPRYEKQPTNDHYCDKTLFNHHSAGQPLVVIFLRVYSKFTEFVILFFARGIPLWEKKLEIQLVKN